MDGRAQIGLVGLTSVDEYMDGTIKKHELTREEKADRIRHIDACDAHPSPVFTYRHQNIIDETVAKVMANKQPEYDFISDDGIQRYTLGDG